MLAEDPWVAYREDGKGETMKRIQLLAGAVLSTVLVTAGPASAAISAAKYESQTESRTNVKRVERDRVALKHSTCIDRYAESHARWMARNQKLKHQKLGPILDGCKLTGVAENIAYGYSSGNRVVTGWMNSPGHRRNLLNSKMRYIGVGAVKDDDGRWWVAQVLGTRK